jgi:Ca-activated chloride channel family protein
MGLSDFFGDEREGGASRGPMSKTSLPRRSGHRIHSWLAAAAVAALAWGVFIAIGRGRPAAPVFVASTDPSYPGSGPAQSAPAESAPAESRPQSVEAATSYVVSDHAETNDFGEDGTWGPDDPVDGVTASSGQPLFDTIGIGRGSGRGGFRNMTVRTSHGASDIIKTRSPRGARPKGDAKFVAAPRTPIDNESYTSIDETPFRKVGDAPLSTFSIDVDTASYSNVRRFINKGEPPPADAIRIEELVNYFPTFDAAPAAGEPLAVRVESGVCPWETGHRLVRIALKSREIPTDRRTAGHLVFLIDVSGSMASDDKLPLLKRSLRMLVDQLGEDDWVSIVTYAESAGLVLAPTNGGDKNRIREAIDGLTAGGCTNGGAGIQLAYETAAKRMIAGAVNRVVLCTDGDFNVGIVNPNELVALIQEKAKAGVFLTILGFGMGNLKDSTMESLADRGNGNYAYIDGLVEARKVLVDQRLATIVTVAKDVKIQVEFNPARVASYRLLGYEDRALAARDFNDDRKDAGDMGAGRGVVALYEIEPTEGAGAARAGIDPLKYQNPNFQPSAAAASGETLTVKVRYKEPTGAESRLLEIPYKESGDATSEDFRFAAAVAAFGLVLRDSPHKSAATLDLAIELASGALTRDPNGYRREFVTLAERAKSLVAPALTFQR